MQNKLLIKPINLLLVILLSILFILISPSINYQFLVPNGFAILVTFLFIYYNKLNKKIILPLLLIGLLQDIWLESLIGYHTCLYIILIIGYNYFFRLSINSYYGLNLLILIFIAPGLLVDSYYNVWGWLQVVAHIIINLIICSYLKKLVFYKKNSKIGANRVMFICQN